MINELTFLGRGSGYHLTENNTSAYFYNNKDLVLIDCGETVFKTLLKNKLLDSMENLYIVITHMHSDHVGSLAGLIGYYYWKYHKKVNLFFPEADKIVMFLELQGMLVNQTYTIITADVLHIPSIGVDITPFQTEHNPIINAYSYYFKFKEGNDLIYSGDSKTVINNVLDFLTAGNILYQDICISNNNDGPHMTLHKISEIIPRSLRNQVYCIHIDGDEYDKKVMEMGFSKVKTDQTYSL